MIAAAFEPIIRKLANAQEQAEREAADNAAEQGLAELKGFDPDPESFRKKRAELEMAKSKAARTRAQLTKEEAVVRDCTLLVSEEQRQIDRRHKSLRERAVSEYRLHDAIQRLNAAYTTFGADARNHAYARAVKTLFDGLNVLYHIRDGVRDPFPALDGYEEHVQRVLVSFESKLAEERERIDRLVADGEAARRTERIYNPTH